jgi:co-chaperonin GroES (HSP10)
MKKSAKAKKRAATKTAGIVVYIPTIKLLHDEVLIKLQHPERHTHGLEIPDTAKRTAGELWRGKVIAVGPGARTKKKGILIKPDVEPGDVVGFFWRAAVVDVTKWPDEESRIIHESDIMWKEVA